MKVLTGYTREVEMTVYRRRRDILGALIVSFVSLLSLTIGALLVYGSLQMADLLPVILFPRSGPATPRDAVLWMLLGQVFLTVSVITAVQTRQMWRGE